MISSLRQPSGGHIRVRQTGRCLESGLLHPPLAALRRFLPSLRQPSGGHIRVRQTGRCLESGLLHPPLAALRRFPRRPLQKTPPDRVAFFAHSPACAALVAPTDTHPHSTLPQTRLAFPAAGSCAYRRPIQRFAKDGAESYENLLLQIMENICNISSR